MTDEELIARLRDGCNLQQRDGERAANRIEALTKERDEAVNQQDSARHSVDVLAKRGRAMIAENAKLHDRIEALEAKLAKAVEALRNCPPTSNPTISAQEHVDRINAWWRLEARATLAEIKGGNDAKSDL